MLKEWKELKIWGRIEDIVAGKKTVEETWDVVVDRQVHKDIILLLTK